MEKVTSKDGTKIAFEKSGQGQPIILVDGALCYRTSGPMGPLAKVLKPHFTVFSYDRRGRGDSGDTQPYNVEREVEDIEALVKEAGESAFVYGISSGAVLAIHAAKRLRGIKKLALYEAPFTLGENSRQASKDYTAKLTKLLIAGRRGDAVALFMTMVGTPTEAINGMRQAPMWSGLEAIAPTLAYDNAIMGDGSVPTEQAAAITVSTLVMDGGGSPAFMHDAAQALTEAIPNAHHHTLEGQTHDVAPEVLAPVLVQFFNK